MSIHEILKELAPCDFGAVPEDDQALSEYVKDVVSKVQEVVDSVPPPSTDSPPARSQGADAAASGDQVTSTGATSDVVVNEEMRKSWGKPMKLSSKDNPHDMAVFKMAAKDRRGAWFARRSVHEGLGFARWKRSLDTEFEESLKVQGKPGEGNIRGIGGEEKIMSKDLPSGKVEVLRLTAQFPGPSAPRDFVELLISSTNRPGKEDAPRQYLLVSRPVTHPDVPEQSPFVRGQYESIEFIREIPVRKTKMMSTTSLPATQSGPRPGDSENKDDVKLDRAATDSQLLNAKSGQISAEDAEATLEARQAQDDVSPKPVESVGSDKDHGNSSGVAMAVDENDELAPNPVEWIMITRSDPGGSVPRFMVERGTPSAIVSDAGKFLEWATQRSMPIFSDDLDDPEATPRQSEDSSATATTAAAAGGTATQVSHAEAAARHAHTMTRTVTATSSSSSSSSDSFVSADGMDSATNNGSAADGGPDKIRGDKYDIQEHELAKKLEIRKAKADIKLDETRERHPHNEDRIKSAERKRERKVDEAQKWHEKQKDKIQQRREKAAKKKMDSESKDDLRQKIGTLTRENEELKLRIQALETKLS